MRLGRLGRGLIGVKKSTSKKKSSKKKYSLSYLKSLDWDDLKEVGEEFGVKFRSYDEAYKEIMKAQK